MDKLKNKATASWFSIVVILTACQLSPTGTPIPTGTISRTSTVPLSSSTPTIWVTPRITATPLYALESTDDDLKRRIEGLLLPFCIGSNEVDSSADWDSSSLKVVEVNEQLDVQKFWISEIADNLDGSRQAFVACKPDSCRNQIYVKDNKTDKVYELDWKFETSSYPIQQLLWINYDTLLFFQSPDPSYDRVIAINFDKKEYIYSAIVYPRSNCPIATPTLTPLPTYPTKQVLLDYTVSGFHTPYDLYFNDYARSYFVIYTDGQIIIPSNPYQQKVLSKEEINQLLTQLENLGFYTLDNDHIYNFGDQNPPKITDGASYCVSVKGNREQNLCSYEPYESFLVPEMKNILQFLNDYQPDGLSAYSPDRILLWVQAGRSPYATDLPKDAISWTEPLLSLETTNEKIMYADGETAKKLYLLYGDKGYVFTQNGNEYTVHIRIVLPHEEITNQYQ